MPAPLTLDELQSVVERCIQRIATLEVEVLTLNDRLQALETQEEDRHKLPFFQRKRAEFDDFPPETT